MVPRVREKYGFPPPSPGGIGCGAIHPLNQTDVGLCPLNALGTLLERLVASLTPLSRNLFKTVQKTINPTVCFISKHDFWVQIGTRTWTNIFVSYVPSANRWTGLIYQRLMVFEPKWCPKTTRAISWTSFTKLWRELAKPTHTSSPSWQKRHIHTLRWTPVLHVSQCFPGLIQSAVALFRHPSDEISTLWRL